VPRTPQPIHLGDQVKAHTACRVDIVAREAIGNNEGKAEPEGSACFTDLTSKRALGMINAPLHTFLENDSSCNLDAALEEHVLLPPALRTHVQTTDIPQRKSNSAASFPPHALWNLDFEFSAQLAVNRLLVRVRSDSSCRVVRRILPCHEDTAKVWDVNLDAEAFL
jgi:hypothetical protein